MLTKCVWPFIAAATMYATLSQRLRQAQQKPEYADVRFLVSDKQEEFAVHRVILAAASPVFAAMFQSDLSANQDTFQLTDIEPEAFHNLLDYVYTDSVSGINENCVFATLYAAKKYLLLGLAEACCRFLIDSISADNLLDILQHCLLLDAPNVTRRCLDEVCQHWDLLVPRLPQCSADVLVAIMSHNFLPCLEVEILSCLIAWADAECVRRELQPQQPGARLQALEASGCQEELLNCVRLSRLSRRQLTDFALPSGLFTDKQLVEAVSRTGDYRHSHPPRNVRADSLKVEPVSVYDYSSLWRPEMRVPHPLPLCGAIEFRCARRLILTGCELFRPQHPPARPPLICASVTDSDDPEDAPMPNCVSEDATYQAGQLVPYYTVNFPSPVALRPGRWYRLRLSMSSYMPHSLADAPLYEPGNKAVQLQMRPPFGEPYASFLCALLCHYSWPMAADA